MPTKVKQRYRTSVVDANGRRHRPYFKDYKTAASYERAAAIALERSEPLPDPTTFVPPIEDLKIGDAIETYFEHCWGEVKDQKGPRNTLGVFSRFVGETMTLYKLNDQVLLSYFKYLRNDRCASGNTSNHHLSHISTLLKTAHSFGHKVSVDLDKLSQFRRRVGPGRTRYFSEAEESEILSTLHQFGYRDYRDFVEFMIYTGARTSEAKNLTWDNVDLENKKVRFTATKDARGKYRERTVDLTDSQGKMMSMLTRRYDKQGGIGLVFNNVSYAKRRRAWEHLRDQLKMNHDPEFVPHTCRHTFASRLASRGVDLYAIQRLMGHQSFQMTQRYAHLAPSTTASAVSVL